jgi:flavin-dependent dehydrogenase
VRRTDPLIVGGGPAGAAAAIRLAGGGARPLLIDRNREAPDHLCGGFLGWDALAALAALDIDPAALGAAPIRRVRVIARGVRIEAALPYAAAGLSRRTLDAALLARAEAVGAGVERGVTVRTIDPATRTIRMDGGGEMEADALFLATGKHDLRGSPRPREAAGGDPAIGLRTRLAATPALTKALAGTIELHLFAHGYAGLLVQEDGAVNLCLSVAQSRLGAAGGTAEGLIAGLADAPRLAERFGAAAGHAPWQAVAAVPYGWRAEKTPPGIFRLGDQAAVIASLAGDGVAIALASAAMAARHHAQGGADAAPAYQRAFAAAARRPLRIAGSLRAMGESPAGPVLIGLFGRIPGLPALLARLTRIGSH